MIAYENKVITLHTPVKIRIDGVIIDTTYGRYLFNEILPEELKYVNETIGKVVQKRFFLDHLIFSEVKHTAYLADAIKNLGFKYATISGLTVSAFDMIFQLKSMNSL
jgi:DNA-directed RNA polymerase subunit beta'